MKNDTTSGDARIERAAVPVTAEQIAAGAAVLDDEGRPVGRNTALMVFDALSGASGAAPVSVAEVTVESIAKNHDAMILLTHGYPTENVISVVDAHTMREARAAVSAATKPTADLSQCEKALRELMSIVRIHSDVTCENFAWAEMSYAEEVLSLLATKPAAQAADYTDIVSDGGMDPRNASAVPLSADAAQEQAREQALEEAAQRCESAELLFDVDELMHRTKKELTAITATKLAAEVRALKAACTQLPQFDEAAPASLPDVAMPEQNGDVGITAAMREGNKHGVKSTVAAHIVAAYLAAQPAEGSAQVATDPTNQYRKRPVVINAIQWPGTKFEQTPPDWFRDAMYAEPGKPGFLMRYGDEIIISTLEGEMRASPGDWIIRGIKGEIYPCKPDIFAATYEPASSAAEGATQAGMAPEEVLALLRDGIVGKSTEEKLRDGGEVEFSLSELTKLAIMARTGVVSDQEGWLVDPKTDQPIPRIDGDKHAEQGGGNG